MVVVVDQICWRLGYTIFANHWQNPAIKRGFRHKMKAFSPQCWRKTISASAAAAATEIFVEIGNKFLIPTCNTCTIFNVFNVCLKTAGLTGKRATTMAIFEFSVKPHDTEVSIFSQG